MTLQITQQYFSMKHELCPDNVSDGSIQLSQGDDVASIHMLHAAMKHDGDLRSQSREDFAAFAGALLEIDEPPEHVVAYGPMALIRYFAWMYGLPTTDQVPRTWKLMSTRHFRDAVAPSLARIPQRKNRSYGGTALLAVDTDAFVRATLLPAATS